MNGFTYEDMRENKTRAALGYVIFFLPLILCKESKLGKYCANQGLLLWICSILVGALFGIFTCIPLIGWLFKLVGGLAQFVLLLIGVMCFLQLATNERVMELPYIGKFKIIQ